jgi:hypothetical protein
MHLSRFGGVKMDAINFIAIRTSTFTGVQSISVHCIVLNYRSPEATVYVYKLPEDGPSHQYNACE